MAKYELTLQDRIQLAIEYQNYENLGKIRPDSMLYNQAALHRAVVLEEISFARATNDVANTNHRILANILLRVLDLDKV